MAKEYTDEELLGRLRELITRFDEAEDQFNRKEWGNKHGERLGKYADKLKLLNGDDFDIIGASFDEYHKDYSDLEDDKYIEALEENIKSVLNRVWPEATPEQVEETAEQICEEHKADEESMEQPEAEVEIEVSADPVESEEAAEEIEENPEAEFVKELEEYKAKTPKRKRKE